MSGDAKIRFLQHLDAQFDRRAPKQPDGMVFNIFLQV
jgi:hypothetical protein